MDTQRTNPIIVKNYRIYGVYYGARFLELATRGREIRKPARNSRFPTHRSQNAGARARKPQQRIFRSAIKK